MALEIRRRLARWLTRGYAPSDDYWYQSVGQKSSSGIAVNDDSALSVSAVYACERLIAGTIGSLPKHIYEDLGETGGRRKAQEHPISRLLKNPNPEQTPMEFWELMVLGLESRGNSYAEKEMRLDGQVAGLWWLNPEKMLVERKEGILRYIYTLPNGQRVIFRPDQIMHLRGMSKDGITGLSTIALFREAIGLGLAAEQYGARFFANDASPGGVIEHPGKLSDVAEKHLSDSWEAIHAGVRRSHRIAILGEGAKFNKIGISPEDAQLVESRKFTVTDIARIFGVPPPMIGDFNVAGWHSITQQDTNFGKHCIRPRVRRIEQKIEQSLFSEADRERFYCKFQLNDLMAGDTSERFNVYAVAIEKGIMTRNEVRALEEMNPTAGGDAIMLPLNMVSGDGQPGEPAKREQEGDDGNGN